MSPKYVFREGKGYLQVFNDVLVFTVEEKTDSSAIGV